MKYKLHILFCLFPLFLFNSCKSEVERAEKMFLKYGVRLVHGIESFDKSVHLSPTDEPNRFVGVFTITTNGVSVNYDVEVGGKGRDQYYELTEDESILQAKTADFSGRVRASYCTNWYDLQNILEGESKLKWEYVNKRMEDLSYYYHVDYSQGAMRRFNEGVTNYVLPFLREIGATKVVYDTISEEDRLQDKKDNEDFWRESIKTARNKWVDDNPQEARRRGITKF